MVIQNNIDMTATKHYVGLTDAQVLESRAKYGANVLTPPEEDSLWDQILEVCNILLPSQWHV